MSDDSTKQKQEGMPVARVVENRSVHLVVIEDDKFLRNLIVRKLTKEGFVVVEAENGKEGLAAMRKELPQMVLLDIILPGMSGYDVLEEIRKDEKLAGVPIIILSNLEQKEEVDHAQSLGVKEFLIKAKFTPGEIVEHIKKILKESYL
jgi:two-component system, OmpR family, alkaline phosphatase synthesis response regulator PhoP